MKSDLLFKQHDNKDCETLLNISRYLYAKYKVDIRPKMIVERNFPANIKVLPTIVMNGELFEGLNKIVAHYEKILKITNIIKDSEQFCKNNPNYRITDNSTHKKIVL
ncbi:hypothetical protein Catovirus_1_304 [Catovirus CTV1]|uniref:Thioredoxin n=1 Tax=Catovirus CTV1 TaxID=1977631 RepID=A0A1V0S981_9VIRU|nr:hypothetical protein Catovirus_1_304 [Catovirus CTV1]